MLQFVEGGHYRYHVIKYGSAGLHVSVFFMTILFSAHVF